MARIDSISLEVGDLASAQDFYSAAFGIGPSLGLIESDAATSGFRGFTLSLTVAQPANAVAYFDAAVAAGATVLKPVTKSFWGFGGVVQAPDGTIFKLASSAKKDSGPGVREFERLVLLLGVNDVKASKRFYVERGVEVKRSFGSKYVEFATDGTI